MKDQQTSVFLGTRVDRSFINKKLQICVLNHVLNEVKFQTVNERTSFQLFWQLINVQ